MIDRLLIVWSCASVTVPPPPVPIVTLEVPLGVVPLPGGFQSAAARGVPRPAADVPVVRRARRSRHHLDLNVAARLVVEHLERVAVAEVYAGAVAGVAAERALGFDLRELAVKVDWRRSSSPYRACPARGCSAPSMSKRPAGEIDAARRARRSRGPGHVDDARLLRVPGVDVGLQVRRFRTGCRRRSRSAWQGVAFRESADDGPARDVQAPVTVPVAFERPAGNIHGGSGQIAEAV